MPNFALFAQADEYQRMQLRELAAALSYQMDRDVKPAWNRTGKVHAYVGLEKQSIPADYWRLQIKGDIGDPSAAGYHDDQNNQPYAVIAYSGNYYQDSITVSHECLEMLIDPSGNSLAAPVPLVDIVPGSDPDVMVRVLREACDPCESFSYMIEGVAVSDFTYPAFFNAPDPMRFRQGTYLDTCKPLQIASGGYVSWLNLSDDHWWQLIDGQGVVDLGSNNKLARGGKTLREWIDGFRKDRRKK